MRAGEQFCDVFVKDRIIYVFPNCEPQAGVRLACGPARKLDLDSSPETIGGAILDALVAFRPGVPFPEDFKAVSLAALKGTGFKSWKSLSTQACRLGISCDGLRVKVTPTVGDGRQNFADLPNKAVTSPLEPAAVGRALFRGVSACEWMPRIG